MKKINIFITKNNIKASGKKLLGRLIKVLVSAIVILLIIFGLSSAYIWYTGRAVAVVDENDSANTYSNTKINLIEQAENVPVSAAVQRLSSPVYAGSNASIDVKTKPGSTCNIVVMYDKKPSLDGGLTEKLADKYGNVSWSWTIDNRVPSGEWPVTVTCAKNDSSAVVVGDIVIKD